MSNDLERHSRSAARLAAVQALYQMETSESGVDRSIADFRHYWMVTADRTPDEEGAAPPDFQHADPDFFESIVRGVVDAQARIDPYIERQLASGWTLKRIDSTLRAVLRCALYEMIRTPDVPARVVINEYLNVAHAFCEDREVAFVNGVLDRAATQARADEISV